MELNRILVLNYEYPPVGGGAGRVAQSLCRHYVSRGLKVTVITGWVNGLRWLEREGDLTILRVPMVKKRMHRTTVIGMASYVISAFLPMCLFIMLKKSDLIHAHFALPVGVLPWAAKKMFRIPYVITLHGGDVPGMVPEQTRHLFKRVKGAALRVVKQADAVKAVSSGLRDLAHESFPIPIEVIPNGIDPSWTIGKCESKETDELRLVFAGRLTNQKNVFEIIKAVRRLNGHFKVRLDILGDGPLLNSLQDTAKSIPGIHFHGWLSERGVKEFLCHGDIFLLPSFSEGMSIAALQAMGQACAMVVSKIPMNKDLLDEGQNGFFCGYDAESIAAAVMKCVPQLENLKKGSLEKAASYSWANIGETYLKCFEAVCRESGIGASRKPTSTPTLFAALAAYAAKKWEKFDLASEAHHATRTAESGVAGDSERCCLPRRPYPSLRDKKKSEHLCGVQIQKPGPLDQDL